MHHVYIIILFPQLKSVRFYQSVYRESHLSNFCVTSQKHSFVD